MFLLCYVILFLLSSFQTPQEYYFIIIYIHKTTKLFNLKEQHKKNILPIKESMCCILKCNEFYVPSKTLHLFYFFLYLILCNFFSYISFLYTSGNIVYRDFLYYLLLFEKMPSSTCMSVSSLIDNKF